jgi:hypothetical protein
MHKAEAAGKAVPAAVVVLVNGAAAVRAGRVAEVRVVVVAAVVLAAAGEVAAVRAEVVGRVE